MIFAWQAVIVPSRLAPTLHVVDLVAPVVRDHHALGARLDPLDGAPELARRPRAARSPRRRCCSLEPKPPPTSGAITRTRSSLMPSWRQRNSRRKCGTWVERPDRQSARRGSRRARRAARSPRPAMRWLTMRRSTITSASRERRPRGRRRPATTRGPCWCRARSWTSGGAGLERRLGVDDDRQRVVLDDDLLGGVDDRVAVGADDHRDRVADVLDLALGERPSARRVLTSTPGGHPGHRQRRPRCRGRRRCRRPRRRRAPWRRTCRSRRSSRAPPASARTPPTAGR